MSKASTPTITTGAHGQQPGKTYATRQEVVDNEVKAVLDKTGYDGYHDYDFEAIAQETIVGSEETGYWLNPKVDFWRIAFDHEYIDPEWRSAFGLKTEDASAS